MNTAAAQDHGTVSEDAPGGAALEALLELVRRQGWTLVRWGDPPDLLATVLTRHGQCDVLLLHDEHRASAYRTCPRSGDTRPWNPRQVCWQYHGAPAQVLHALLALPAPGHPGAPAHPETAAPHCRLPPQLPAPVTYRPLGHHHR